MFAKFVTFYTAPFSSVLWSHFLVLQLHYIGRRQQSSFIFSTGSQFLVLLFYPSISHLKWLGHKADRGRACLVCQASAALKKGVKFPISSEFYGSRAL